LKAGGYLDDKIIHAGIYLTLVGKNSIFFNHCAIIDTMFSSANASGRLKESIMFASTERLGLALHEHEFIALPFNWKNIHWLVILICHPLGTDPKRAGILVFDSAVNVTNSALPGLIEDLILFVNEILPNHSISGKTHPVRKIHKTQQKNSFDCGVFLLEWIRVLSELEEVPGSFELIVNKLTEMSPNQKQATVRRTSLFQLFDDKLNELKL